MTKKPNLDRKTIDGFGDEWSRFDQSEISEQERNLIFESYFSIFPWPDLFRTVYFSIPLAYLLD